jgi:uncharacterized protein YeaO (DUF488 family)
MTTILLKRVYDPAEKSDGFRILVDRLWPRGLKKENAHADVWMKEVAPSAALRKWFNHEPEKWIEFNKKYKAELKSSPQIKELIQYCKKHKAVTLLYSAKDEEHNQAVALGQFINRMLSKND